MLRTQAVVCTIKSMHLAFGFARVNLFVVKHSSKREMAVESIVLQINSVVCLSVCFVCRRPRGGSRFWIRSGQSKTNGRPTINFAIVIAARNVQLRIRWHRLLAVNPAPGQRGRSQTGCPGSKAQWAWLAWCQSESSCRLLTRRTRHC